MAAVNLSVKALLAAVENQQITIKPVPTKNKFGVKSYAFYAAGQQFCLKTDEADCGGYTDRFPALNIGATPRMEALMEALVALVPALVPDIAAITNEPVQTGAWFVGPFFKIAYSAEDDQVMEVVDNGPPEPVPWSTIEKGDKMMLIVNPRIWQKGAEAGIKFWTRHARIVERGNGGNDAFAAVDEWEAGTRLDQMSRSAAAADNNKKKQKISDFNNDYEASVGTSDTDSDNMATSPPLLTRATSVGFDELNAMDAGEAGSQAATVGA
jgi:hypothetical protein